MKFKKTLSKIRDCMKNIKFDSEKPEKNYSASNRKIIKEAYEKGILSYSGDAGCATGKALWCSVENLDNFINLIKGKNI